VGDLDDDEEQPIVLDLMDDSIDTLAHAIASVTRELLASRRPRIVAERVDTFE
jgi:hypothetical protein